ncbi:MAG: ABC transporter ATP-binding protein [Bacteroidia bacterium]|nr:ABC transporter ATP-binding protein [Bacteroidia bacterium]
MSQTAISIENIGKKYRIQHQRKAAQDSIAGAFTDNIKSLFKPQSKTHSEEDFWAIKDISLEIKKGDRVGVIGRNGAGKSTLLKVLSRIVKPTTGRIEFDGRMASLLEVGTGFHGDLSGRENIYLNGSVLGMSKREIDAKFDEIVAFSEIEKFLDTPVKRYSSGMYVRLAFAVAAHLEPDILIVDEVLAVGDAEFQKKCMGKMEDVSNKEGRTILFVSHQMGAVQNLCNKGLFLRNGTMVNYGPIGEIVNEYLALGNTISSSVFTFESQPNYKKTRAYFTKVEFKNAEGKLSSDFPIGDPMDIHLHFNCENEMKGVVVGIGIVTATELPLITTWSNPENFSAGSHELVFTLKDLFLVPGVYKIIVGISRGGESLDYNPNWVYITISDVNHMLDRQRLVNTASALVLNQLPYRLVSSAR